MDAQPRPQSSGAGVPPGRVPPTAVGAAVPDPSPGVQIIEERSGPASSVSLPWSALLLIADLIGDLIYRPKQRVRRSRRRGY